LRGRETGFFLFFIFLFMSFSREFSFVHFLFYTHRTQTTHTELFIFLVSLLVLFFRIRKILEKGRENLPKREILESSSLLFVSFLFVFFCFLHNMHTWTKRERPERELEKRERKLLVWAVREQGSSFLFGLLFERMGSTVWWVIVDWGSCTCIERLW